MFLDPVKAFLGMEVYDRRIKQAPAVIGDPDSLSTPSGQGRGCQVSLDFSSSANAPGGGAEADPGGGAT